MNLKNQNQDFKDEMTLYQLKILTMDILRDQVLRLKNDLRFGDNEIKDLVNHILTSKDIDIRRDPIS